MTSSGSGAGSGGGRFEVYETGEFRRAVPAEARVEKVAGGFGFVEGPVWTNRDGGYLIFSDIPRHELKRWSEREGVTTFRAPSCNNGNTRDAQGRLLTAEHDGRRVSVTEADGTVRTLVERYQGRRLNSPNDLVVKADGTIWFTDPPYGLPHRTEGKELDKNHVFRFDPYSGELQSAVDDFGLPNGLCFDGRVWSSAGDGLHVFDAGGALLGKVITPDAPGRFDPQKIGPEVPANLCFGGPDWQTVYITACTSLYRLRAGVRGAGILWE